MTVTFAVVAVQGTLLIVHRTITGPAPPVWVKVALGVPAFGAKVPVPPLTTLQAPIPTNGVFPPRPVVVALAQMGCTVPAVAKLGAWLIVMLTLAVEAVHGALLMVQRTITGPVPPVWVKVALGAVALENVPVPPLTTLQPPVPTVGALPPRPFVVPFTQIVCGPPAAARVGA